VFKPFRAAIASEKSVLKKSPRDTRSAAAASKSTLK